ncbi:outer membrane protein [Consotaella aegiceratis]|uniref:outer membrane protein n=1 Tax=Consotaella aegiceratis TaxID=3097961 RepID=UPI002F42ACF7
MKRFALLLASTAFVTPALAADVVYEEPPAPAPVYEAAPAYTWSGFYVGGQLGGAFGGDVYDRDDDDAGFIGGIHAGYDYQMDNFVFGGLVDLNFMDAQSTALYSDGAGSVAADSYRIKEMGTARLKAGYAMDRFMVYGTGGLAWANIDDSTGLNATAEAAGYSASNDSDNFGYAVGGGLDYLATPNVSVGVEYLYTNLGEHDFDVDSPTGTDDFSTSSDLDFHTVWAKASYHFN